MSVDLNGTKDQLGVSRRNRTHPVFADCSKLSTLYPPPATLWPMGGLLCLLDSPRMPDACRQIGAAERRELSPAYSNESVTRSFAYVLHVQEQRRNTGAGHRPVLVHDPDTE
jgi:hypothetical protein